MQNNRNERYNEIQCPIYMMLCDAKEAIAWEKNFTPILQTQVYEDGWETGHLQRIYIPEKKSRIEQMINQQPYIKARVRTNYDDYPITVKLQKVMEGIEISEKISQLYFSNGWDMPDISTAFFHGFYDVKIEQKEDFLRKGERLQSIKIDWGELEGLIQHHVTLLWNVEKFLLKENGFPQREEEERYRHTLALPVLAATYLIDLPKQEICSLKRKEGRLDIFSEEKMYRTWEAYMIRAIEEGEKEEIKQKGQWMLSNGFLPSLEEILQKKRRTVTEAEMQRRIESYENSSFFSEIRLSERWTYVFYPKHKNLYLNQEIMEEILLDMKRIYPGIDFKGRIG